MRFNDVVQQATCSIKTHPLRIFLIILAMSIGISSVTVLTALGDSARQYVMHEFEALGTHLLIVLPGRTETTGGQPPLFGATPRDLTLADAQALSRLSTIKAIAPITIGSAPISVRGLEREATVIGSTAALRHIRHLSLAQGKFLPKNTASKKERPICIIGQTIKQELFAQQEAIGQWLRISHRRYRVIGVLASEGQSIGVDFDNMVIIPAQAAQTLFNTQALFRILIETYSPKSMQQAAEQIKAIIRERHEGEEDITLITQDSVVNTFNEILTTLTLTVSSIASISLLVSGILIMNVMWVSVNQRTAEIGLLKALGATQQQLTALFLMESAILSLIGACVGIVLGAVILGLIQYSYPDFPITLPLWAISLALMVALSTALIFSIFPAIKAAQLNPITALHKR